MANDLFLELEQKYGLPSGFLARTYQIESGSGKNLYNPLSKAAGGFQFIPSTAKQYGLKDSYDLAQSADAAARLASDNRASLQKAGIESPTAAQLYLAHQQGAGGANKLLSGTDKKATEIVGKNAVVWNAGNSDMTGYEFANNIMSKFEGTEPAAAAPPAGVSPPWSNPTSALGSLDKQYLNGGLSWLASPITGLLGGGSPQNKEPSPIGFVKPEQMMGATLPQSLMGSQPAGGVGPMATVGGGQAAMAAVPLAQPTTGWSMDSASAKELAGLSSLGNALMAAGAAKGPPTSMLSGVSYKPKVKDDLFAGLFGYMG